MPMASLILKAFRRKGVDRRTCHRTVPMKVLVFGMSRTGTLSLRHALRILGYHDVYHMSSIIEDNPRDEDMWIEAFDSKFENKGRPFTREDWDQLLGHCMALSDAPCLSFKEELAAAYPEAKIILSLRDSPEQWHNSVQQTLVPVARLMVAGPHSLWYRLYNWFLPELPLQMLSEKLALHANILKMVNMAPEMGIQMYTEHNDQVRAIAGDWPGRLLEMNVKQGWAPLCSFLGEDIPTDENGEKVPFPRVNDAATFNSGVETYRFVRHCLVAINVSITIIVAVAVGVILLRCFRKPLSPLWKQLPDL